MRLAPPRVWVTRAQPGADETADRVSALGIEPVVAPLIEVRRLDAGAIDLTGVAAIAFTSANAVLAFAEQCAERTYPVYAVGGRTANVARAAGFAEVISADGDVEALARLIAARAPMAGALLHPRAARVAGDLAGLLAGSGVPVRSLPVYESIIAPSGAATRAAFKSATTILLHSPLAARAFADLAASHGEACARMAALCFSPNVATPLAALPLRRVEVAAAPNEAALLDLLRRQAE